MTKKIKSLRTVTTKHEITDIKGMKIPSGSVLHIINDSAPRHPRDGYKLLVVRIDNGVRVDDGSELELFPETAIKDTDLNSKNEVRKNKKLKIWNGRGHGKYEGGTFYVAAYSRNGATELIAEASGLTRISASEIRVYYSFGTWGNPMKDIVPTEPCVYASKRIGDKPERII